MFSNIGKKIKLMAVVFFSIGVLASLITGIIFFADEEPLIGALIIIGGSFVSWVSVMLIYGFGQLVENSDIIAAQFKRVNKKYVSQREREELQTAKASVRNSDLPDDALIDITCPECKKELSVEKGDIINNADIICPYCEKMIDMTTFS